ncbi:50S ribosomal protein L25 [uncultured Ezakiella sp.]|uniref:50S ribosomal protein L25 n=1 Tax=uncultured Ezakiella sp. TaxID=1637529 RepID=UPI0025DDFBF0|nr:50S ribosomal protein L25 [uncultured Ezakiella sp.]
MAKITIDAQEREGLGKNKVKKIRAEKNVPAAIFEKGEETHPITVSARDFDIVFKEAGFTNIVDVMIDGKAYPTIIKEIDRHPFKNQVLHVNFQGIKMDEAIRVEVPIDCLNRDDIKVQPSVFIQTLNTLHIECLPGDLPDVITIDVIDMEIGDQITVADLDIVKDEKITVLTDLDETVCLLTHEVEEAEEEEETEDVSAADVPEIGEDSEAEEE